MKKQLAPFVRSLPLDIPVAEVIKRARAAGLELKPYHVYQTRTPSELEREFRRCRGVARARPRTRTHRPHAD